MDDVSSNKIAIVNHWSVGSILKRAGEWVTANNLKTNPTDALSASMSDKKIPSAGKYSKKMSELSYSKCTTHYSPIQNVGQNSR